MIGLRKDCHPILFYIIHRITLMREIQIIIAIVNNQIKLVKLQVGKVMQFQLMFKMEIIRSNKVRLMEQNRRILGLEELLKDLVTWIIRVKLAPLSQDREIRKDNLTLEVWTKVAVEEVEILIKNKAA